MALSKIPSVEKLSEQLKQNRYVAGDEVATALHLSIKLDKPLLVEGAAGCGKTELAKVLGEILDTDVIRLQCYEGLDANSAIYEWDYLRQLLAIRMRESKEDAGGLEHEIFSQRYLLERPLLKALLHRGERPPVLLIDELDRADEEFEGFLLEFLAEFQVTVPELGTLRATHKPYVIITSNRTRELGDGIRRRCLYLYITYPDFERELQIVRLKVPELGTALSGEVVEFVQNVRRRDDLQRRPGVSETLDWANALQALGSEKLDVKAVSSTVSCLIKDADDKRIFTDALIRELLSCSKPEG
jgi:MoxR-like ATPase